MKTELERTIERSRETRETKIQLELNLDGSGEAHINTGIGFLDHMLETLTRHSQFDLRIHCQGDLDVDGHHTTEDCAIVLGEAIDTALAERRGITRFGYAYAPLDEALVRTVIDLSGRPSPVIHLPLNREMIGELATENIIHFFQTLAVTMKAAVHIDLIKGNNDHHKTEAAFKAFALALNQAVQLTGRNSIPSTKETLK